MAYSTLFAGSASQFLLGTPAQSFRPLAGLQVWGRRWRSDEPAREVSSLVEGHAHAVAVSVETPSRAVTVRTRYGVSDQRARACANHAARDGAAGAPARNCGSEQRARACANRAAGEGRPSAATSGKRQRHRASERERESVIFFFMGLHILWPKSLVGHGSRLYGFTRPSRLSLDLVTRSGRDSDAPGGAEDRSSATCLEPA